jgi:tRNA threonylcarbamoyladenosine modification (KEOPS) complex  Pcc1 subunit
MKNLEQIQAQLADISDIIAAMQQEQLQQHRNKLKQSGKEIEIYQFDEKGLRAFIEQIVEEATENIIRAINNEEIIFDTEDVVDMDLAGNCIDVTIDASYIASAIEEYAIDEEVVDVEQAIKDAKQYHTIKL